MCQIPYNIWYSSYVPIQIRNHAVGTKWTPLMSSKPVIASFKLTLLMKPIYNVCNHHSHPLYKAMY